MGERDDKSRPGGHLCSDLGYPPGPPASRPWKMPADFYARTPGPRRPSRETPRKKGTPR